MQAFRASSPVIDFDHPLVAARAAQLAFDAPGALELARRAFLFVRDDITHSGDVRAEAVTLKASEVLAAGTGWCFAKSHLLAALLRANGLPAALCYQRLRKDDAGGYTLHGFNAVYLPEHGWYRCDARGNKPGIAAAFMPPLERLAWRADAADERDFSARFAEPVPPVVRCLATSRSFADVMANLPDAEDLQP